MKVIKEKPAKRMPKSNTEGKIPKAAMKKIWTEVKEKSRTKLWESTSTQEDGNYTAAQDTGTVMVDTSYSAINQNTDFTVQRGRKFARKQIEKYRERHAEEQAETTHAHAASERGVSPKQARHQSSARAVGRICPASGRKRRSSPPRPHRTIFAA